MYYILQDNLSPASKTLESMRQEGLEKAEGLPPAMQVSSTDPCQAEAEEPTYCQSR
jgi:hypothetical protein